jgi:uncharacterized protein (DUF1697 family)
MHYVGLVRNVMLGRQGLDRVLLLRLVDAAGGRSAESHLTTGNLTFEAAFRVAIPVDRWELSVAFLPLRSAPLDPARVPRLDGLEV